MAIKVATTMDRFAPALISLWQAQAALSGVAVTDGPPEPAVFDRGEFIWVGDIEFNVRPHSIDRTNMPQLEEYVQRVIISVVHATRAGQAAANARAWALYAACADALRANPQLTGYLAGDGLIISALPAEGGNFSKRTSEDATTREAAIEWGVRVKARI